eukprot:Plantae.Rhodophyta-Palmaria_palmata.ctg22387.p2 GENE.Plantae.Rhodophyta-Palmaria_palmata.ctg22387~~Plantae.Rhodophyta-Palmaria_palmata.ctg22387.p2  ORF type:complete len:133 (-),score=7.99 Plantae.Rhodophyta-Palmaria_palmata.ctg22387:142-540(-)
MVRAYLTETVLHVQVFIFLLGWLSLSKVLCVLWSSLLIEFLDNVTAIWVGEFCAVVSTHVHVSDYQHEYNGTLCVDYHLLALHRSDAFHHLFARASSFACYIHEFNWRLVYRGPMFFLLLILLIESYAFLLS